MASEIRTLKDGDIEIHPRTVARAVHTSSGSTIDVEIENAKTDTSVKLGDVNAVLENILNGSTLEEVNTKIDQINGEVVGTSTMDKLAHTAESKDQIRQAIQDKGVTVPDATPLREYAGLIGNIIESSTGFNAVYSMETVTVNEAGEIPVWPYKSLVDPTYGNGLSDEIYFALAYFTYPSQAVLCCLPLGKKDLGQWMTSSGSIEITSSAIRYTSPDVNAAAYWTVDRDGAYGLVGQSCSLYICKK